MTHFDEHPFIQHPSHVKKETCRLCLAEVQAKKEVIQTSGAVAKEKQRRLDRCDVQLKNMYWDISKKAAERSKHICYCRHADASLRASARRAHGIASVEAVPSTIQLPSFKKQVVTAVRTSPLRSAEVAPSPEAAQDEPISPKRKRAARRVGVVRSYREPSDDEGLEKEATSIPASKKPRVRAETQESSDDSDSSSDQQKDYSDFLAPSTSSSSRSRSRSTTGTPLSAHQFSTTFARLTTTASPAPPVLSASPSLVASPAATSKSRSQSLPHNREEALLVDRIEHYVSSMLRECYLPADAIDKDEMTAQKPKKSKFEEQKPNIPQMIYKLQGALGAVKTLAEEAKDSIDVTKAGLIGLQHLQTRLDELQEVQGVKPGPSKGATPARTLSSGDEAMWARLEKEVETDEKLAKRKARAARGYSPSQPYYEDSDHEIQVL